MSRTNKSVLVPLAFVSLLGCNNPLWKFDHIRVRGVMDGTSCRVWVNDQPFHSKRDSIDTKTSLMAGMLNGKPEADWVEDGFHCNDVLMTFLRQGEGWPRRVALRVYGEDRVPRSGEITVTIDGTKYSKNRWPLAFQDAKLVGFEGTVTIDSIASFEWSVPERLRRQDAVWGRFDVIARRE